MLKRERQKHIKKQLKKCMSNFFLEQLFPHLFRVCQIKFLKLTIHEIKKKAENRCYETNNINKKYKLNLNLSHFCFSRQQFVLILNSRVTFTVTRSFWCVRKCYMDNYVFYSLCALLPRLNIDSRIYLPSFYTFSTKVLKISMKLEFL